jgi:YidC/Oxa1 family membrane protein insertase
MSYLYHTILYNPLLNILIFLYNTIAVQDLGLAIILLTILIRLILFPIFHKSARHQIVMQKLQPAIKKIQDTHKGDREKQARAMMALYKEHNINPFSGFLLLIVQLPILIALYQIILKSLKPGLLAGLYNFVSTPAVINASFLGLINLQERSIFIVVLAGLAQYLQAKLAISKKEGAANLTPAEKTARQMALVGPLFTVIIFYNLPAAIGLYWLITSLFSIVQQIIVNKQISYGKYGDVNKQIN